MVATVPTQKEFFAKSSMTIYYKLLAGNGKYLTLKAAGGGARRVYASADEDDAELFTQVIVLTLPGPDTVFALQAKSNGKFLQLDPDYKQGNFYMAANADATTWTSTNLVVHIAGKKDVGGTKRLVMQARALNQKWLSVEKKGSQYPVLASVSKSGYPTHSKTQFVLIPA